MRSLLLSFSLTVASDSTFGLVKESKEDGSRERSGYVTGTPPAVLHIAC